MAHVNLGVDQRNPGRSGQTKLLKVAMGEVDDFEMVRFDWYREKLDRIQISLNSRNGAYAWVIGDRGTGKSEVLSHLFCQQISMGGGKKPRLPLYISVSEEARRMEVPTGVPKGKVTVALINHLCAKALKESFEFLRSYEGDPELYKDLRKLLKSADFYDFIIPWLQQPDFELLKFCNNWRTDPSTKDSLRIAIYIDDMDKIKEVSAREFFSHAQTDLSELVSEEKVTFLTSVTKDFIKVGRDDEGLNYCLDRQHFVNESDIKELTVPDLGDLPAADVQDLINDRLTYLHWGEPDVPEGPPWVADFDRKPHASITNVIGDGRWKSFDPTSMRRNGALMSLNAWLAARKQVSIRQVLRNLQAVLNDCDKPGTELTADILEKKLKNNDTSDISSIRREMKSRMKEIETIRLDEEHGMLARIKNPGEVGSLWDDLLYVTMERTSLGKWDVPEGIGEARTGQIKRLTNQSFKENSAVFQFLNLVVDLNKEDDDLLPNVHARSPDDVFSVIGIHELQGVILEELTERKKNEFQIESNEMDYSSTDDEKPRLSDIPGIVGEAYHSVLGNQFSVGDYSDPRRAEDLGKELALQIVRGVILSGKKNWTGPGGLNQKITTLHEDDWNKFRRSLLQWFTLRVDRGKEEERMVLAGLESILFASGPFALMESKLALTFDEMVHRKNLFSPLGHAVKDMVNGCNILLSKEGNGYSVSAKVSGLDKTKCIKKSPAEVLGSGLIVTEKIQYRIVDENEELNFEDLGSSLDIIKGAITNFLLEEDYVNSYKQAKFSFTNSIILDVSHSRAAFGFSFHQAAVSRNQKLSENAYIFGGLVSGETYILTTKSEWKVSGFIRHDWEFASSVTINFRNGKVGSKVEKTLEIDAVLDKEG